MFLCFEISQIFFTGLIVKDETIIPFKIWRCTNTGMSVLDKSELINQISAKQWQSFDFTI